MAEQTRRYQTLFCLKWARCHLPRCVGPKRVASDFIEMWMMTHPLSEFRYLNTITIVAMNSVNTCKNRMRRQVGCGLSEVP